MVNVELVKYLRQTGQIVKYQKVKYTCTHMTVTEAKLCAKDLTSKVRIALNDL